MTVDGHCLPNLINLGQLSKHMTTHELAKLLLDFPDIPVAVCETDKFGDVIYCEPSPAIADMVAEGGHYILRQSGMRRPKVEVVVIW